MKSIGSQMAGQLVRAYLERGGSELHQQPLQDPESLLARGMDIMDSHLGSQVGGSKVDRKVYGCLPKLWELGTAGRLGGLAALSQSDKTLPEMAQEVLEVTCSSLSLRNQNEMAAGGVVALNLLADRTSQMGAQVALICATSPSAVATLESVAQLFEPSPTRALAKAAGQICEDLEKPGQRDSTQAMDSVMSMSTLSKMAGKLGQADVQKASNISFQLAEPPEAIETRVHGAAKAISLYRGPETSVSKMAEGILKTPNRGGQSEFQSAALGAMKTLLGDQAAAILPETIADPRVALEILAHSGLS